MQANVDASGDSKTPQQPPTPPLPPPVERDEYGEGGNGKGHRDDVQKGKIKPKHWLKYVEPFCALALVAITFYYTKAAFRQAQASEVAAYAAKCAADTATESLKLTRGIFEASQAAFIDWKVETISYHAQTVSIAFTNSGHIPAKNIVGTITVKRLSANGKVLQSTTRPFSRNVIAPNGGFIQEFIGISSSENLDSLLGQDITASGTIAFDDGAKRSTQQFCSGMLMTQNHGPHWEDCQNIADRKKYLPD